MIEVIRLSCSEPLKFAYILGNLIGLHGHVGRAEWVA